MASKSDLSNVICNILSATNQGPNGKILGKPLNEPQISTPAVALPVAKAQVVFANGSAARARTAETLF
jgi:hypothetical protein